MTSSCEKVKVGQVWVLLDRNQQPYEVLVLAAFRDLRGVLKVVFQRLPEKRGPGHPRYFIRQLPFAPKLAGSCYLTCGGTLKKKAKK